MGSLSDGTSNTLIFGEAIVGVQGGNRVKGNVAHASSADSQTGITPNDCMATSSDKKVYITTLSTDAYGRGHSWILGTPMYTAFLTILPPNSASCVNQVFTREDMHFSSGVFSASSNHTGGINALYGDGSVSFIGDTVSNRTSGISDSQYNVSGVTSGKSPFGVWGAVGSVNGGESERP